MAILAELRSHAPFTLFGAATGILCMLLFRSVSPEASLHLFQVFHPTHVVLSAIVTASLFKLYKGKVSFLVVLLLGYLGSVGVATLSDCILPFFGESILGVAIPLHSDLHSQEETHGHDNEGQQSADSHDAQVSQHDSSVTEAGQAEANGRARLHLGFIEDWYLVNPAALLGIIIGYLWPRTKFPHAGHILVSTWASSFHILMNTHRELSFVMLIGVFVVLFIAVWLPCCVSDIVFPMLFVKADVDLSHSHH
ncbi:MAG: hypothetical protein A2Z25_23405 [Planctomycetes bacterium RBG_16_55_9]|nr:MAG: hypothetical protein A2Z25_23405 [Planctomycetes bacterium RBG_16_55_9]